MAWRKNHDQLAQKAAKEERIQRAIKAYKDIEASGKIPSLRAIAKRNCVVWETLRNRINRGALSRGLYSGRLQRLTPLEEEVLVGWCKQLEAWGYPARIT